MLTVGQPAAQDTEPVAPHNEGDIFIAVAPVAQRLSYHGQVGYRIHACGDGLHAESSIKVGADPGVADAPGQLHHPVNRLDDRADWNPLSALADIPTGFQVAVVGHDADLDGCQRVVEGTQLMTVYKPIDKIAKAAAEIAVKMVNGEKTEVENRISDGKYEVPYYIIEPVPVTKRNMVETIVEDGFHRLEEVYRNIPKEQWPAN